MTTGGAAHLGAVAGRPPRVTVLMAVFNTEAYLRESIQSILSQSLQDLELIIVDDGSTDASWTIVEESSAADPRVVAFRRDVCGGASAALNAGLTRARGLHITRQDSDDVSLPDRISEQVSYLDSHPSVGAVGTAVRMIDRDGQEGRRWRGLATNQEIQAALLDRMCFCGPTVMARRTAFEAAGFHFDEAVSGSEDYELCLRLSEVTQLANLDEALYLYREHSGSESHRRRPRQICNKAVALEKAIQRRYGSTPPPEVNGLLARDYFRATVTARAAGQPEARDYLSRTLAVDPRFFEKSSVIEHVVRRYTPRESAESALEFTRSMFDGLMPPTATLRRLRRRLISEQHLEQAFSHHGAHNSGPALRSLWEAVRTKPGCLLNPGVLSLLLKHMAGGFARARVTRSDSAKLG